MEIQLLTWLFVIALALGVLRFVFADVPGWAILLFVLTLLLEFAFGFDYFAFVFRNWINFLLGLMLPGILCVAISNRMRHSLHHSETVDSKERRP